MKKKLFIFYLSSKFLYIFCSNKKDVRFGRGEETKARSHPIVRGATEATALPSLFVLFCFSFQLLAFRFLKFLNLDFDWAHRAELARIRDKVSIRRLRLDRKVRSGRSFRPHISIN